MLQEIFKTDRRLRIQHGILLGSAFVDENINNIVEQFLTEYSRFYNLKAKDILNHYYNFVEKYSEDIKIFVSTGKYPIQLGKNGSVDRIEYDISLILSPIVAIHRHRIFNHICNYCTKLFGKTLLVGIGPGLELEFLRNQNTVIDAYDINISKFVKERFADINLYECKFTGKTDYYDNIIAVELLEHLIDPYSFIKMCFDSLKNEGRFLLTTATNVPQSDHFYNFNCNQEFENKVRSFGFKIIENEDLNHHYINNKLNAKNTWYILEK